MNKNVKIKTISREEFARRIKESFGVKSATEFLKRVGETFDPETASRCQKLLEGKQEVNCDEASAILSKAMALERQGGLPNEELKIRCPVPV